jgi:hypothetical protein
MQLRPTIPCSFVVALMTYLVLGCGGDNPVDSNFDGGTQGGAAELTIDDSVFDFGYAPQNSVISHVFWLKSTGNNILRITAIKPG